MVEKTTVIIIGAGASKEVNLPTGDELKYKIARALDFQYERGYLVGGNKIIYDAIKWAIQNKPRLERTLAPYQAAADQIRKAMPQADSIDDFIHAHKGNQPLELCGKLAIVTSILNAENESTLYFSPRGTQNTINFSRIEETWFTPFFQLLRENCQVDHLEERLPRISLIIFNYDRCVEHFLYHALQNFYPSLTAECAGELVASMNIYHPYGVVGSLPWQKGEHKIPFGGEPLSQELLNLASQIRTFTEGVNPDSSDIHAIRKAVSSSGIVLFLGFAYHLLNLDLIMPYDSKTIEEQQRKVFGTAVEVSEDDCSIIASDLTKRTHTNPKSVALRRDLICYKLFREYRRSLSLS